MPADLSSPLWAITAYFNPCHYAIRRVNYRLFQRRLPIPLVTVELAFGPPELGPGDAARLIQLHDGDIMWQKERLLNLALRALPPTCRAVAWLDCDVLFVRDDWPDRAWTTLQTVPLLQPFARVGHLPPGAADTGHPLPEQVEVWRPSFMGAVASGRPLADCFRRPDRLEERSAIGMAWVARREVLDTHGVYDPCIIGGGDGALVGAAFGTCEPAYARHCMNPAQRAHYASWAEQFHKTVRSQVGYVEGDLLHLWHGDVANRHYRVRFEEMAAFGFDPVADIVAGPTGAWRWNSAKPTMHAYVANHFVRRREDG